MISGFKLLASLADLVVFLPRAQDMTSQLRESQKEADRDLWEQQNTEKQNIMTVAALFMAGAFAMAVEGQLPAYTGSLMLIPFIEVVDAYYFMLAFFISMVHFASFYFHNICAR